MLEINPLEKKESRKMADLDNPSYCWKALSKIEPAPEPAWHQWLTDTGSLTQLLIEKSQNKFAVEVIAEEWLHIQSPALVSQFGPLASGHRYWSRKVRLLGRGEPWVLAHTLLPEHSLCSPLRDVLELKNKPLGEYLFSHPDLRRMGMEVVQFNRTSWGRRSLFYLFGKPIMVAEFFLPALLTD